MKPPLEMGWASSGALEALMDEERSEVLKAEEVDEM